MTETVRHQLNDIPLIYTPGDERLVIWLPGFSGDKEACLPQLQALARIGYTALSFDPYQHGERMVESREALAKRVTGNIRRYFWPILAKSAREVTPIIDWASAELGINKVAMGGVSMGGDITVAACGIDQRIDVATPCIATPDWLRPGSFEPPGKPDEQSQSDFDDANPMTHLARYEHCPTIHFQNGVEDRQVPAEASIRFRDALRNTSYANHPDRIEATLHEDTGHQFTHAMWKNCKQSFALL
ncbi:MAG: prolyl oligopeptidase family serine peptidase [Pseudomonadota bacterium]